MILIETFLKALIEHVKEDVQYWQLEGIVEIEKIDNKYVKIKGIENSKIFHYQEVDSTLFNHEYIWQTSGYCEDDYYGHILLPLPNTNKYLDISYQC